LVDNISFPTLQSLLLELQLVYFRVDLDLEIVDICHYLRVSFLKSGDIVVLMVPMHNTFRTNRRRHTVEAEIVDFFIRMFATRVSLRSQVPISLLLGHRLLGSSAVVCLLGEGISSWLAHYWACVSLVWRHH